MASTKKPPADQAATEPEAPAVEDPLAAAEADNYRRANADHQPPVEKVEAP